MNDELAPGSQTSAGGLDFVRKQARAHVAVAVAIRSGKLRREPCEVCGAGVTDAHHDDYDLPLEVRWLCRLHHRGVHAQHGRKEPRGTVTLRSLRRRIPDEPTWIVTITDDGLYETVGLWIPPWLADE